MTPADEATFIALWQQGLSQDAIAQQMGCPVGTVKSRAHTLAHQGHITPRPRGGSPLSRRTQARPEDPPAPVQTPAAPPAPSARPTRDPPAITMVAVPELRELIQRFSGLEARVAALEDGTRAATRDPPAPAIPPAGTRTPGSIEQWTVRLSTTLIARIKAEAAAAEKPPSHLLEALAWQALRDREGGAIPR